MPTETDWLDKLADETGIGYEPLVAMINAILDAEAEIDRAKSIDAILKAGGAGDFSAESYAGMNGEIKGLVKAMKFLDAKSETIVEAIRQARKERAA
jgi:hypothetical protein